MSKLHELFLNENFKINGGQEVKKLIQIENLDINEQDLDGNTLLHLMVTHVSILYKYPYINGDSRQKTEGYVFFLDDLEILFVLGADPSKKNFNNMTPIDLLLNEPRVVEGIGLYELRDYLILIQKYYPDFSMIIRLIEYGVYRSIRIFLKNGEKAHGYLPHGWNKSYPKHLMKGIFL